MGIILEKVRENARKLLWRRVEKIKKLTIVPVILYLQKRARTDQRIHMHYDDDRGVDVLNLVEGQ